MATAVKTRLASSSRRRILMWCTFVSLLLGAIEFGGPLDYMLSGLRDRLRPVAPSGQIVVVGIDDRAAQRHGRWPWPRTRHVDLTRKLFEAGANRVFFDFVFAGSEPSEDPAFAAELARHPGRVFLAASLAGDGRSAQPEDVLPTPALRRNAQLVSIRKWVSFFRSVPTAPYRKQFSSQVLPSVESVLAGRDGEVGEEFEIDYAIRADQIPYWSADAILSGEVGPGTLAGKDVVVGIDQASLGDRFTIPGHGIKAGVFVIAIGAETLLIGRPVSIGWLPLVAVALLMAAGLLMLRSHQARAFAIVAGVIAITAIQILLDHAQIGSESSAGLFLIVSAGVWGSFRRQLEVAQDSLLVNDLSGLPSIDALLKAPEARTGYLVAAHVENFLSTISRLDEQQAPLYVAAITDRFRLGTMAATLYHDQDGTFFWIVPEQHLPQLIDNLAALDVIFRAAIKIGEHLFDTSVAFGIEEQIALDPAKRIVNARTAVELSRKGDNLWTVYDPHDVEKATWSLSVISELDAAMEAGDFWIAYQPKVRLSDRKIIGAEALARWDHPRRGAISPAEFVRIAEQRHRIDRMTAFVANRALADAAVLMRADPEFTIAINISPVLLDNIATVSMLVEACVRHAIFPNRVTLEITETAPIDDDGGALANLNKLRELGFGISIDDYGTGMANLEYLGRVPASELKIDRRFITGIADDATQVPLVKSTIDLAHSVGLSVVAEGVETQAAADALMLMGCDGAQGYYFGKPLPIQQFIEMIRPDAGVKMTHKG